jgi:hypothetical protein
MTDRAPLTRRSLLSLAGVAGVGLVVAACSKDDDPTVGGGSGTPSSSTPTAKPAATSIEPTKLPLAGGVTVTVAGTALGAVRGVTVGGIAARDVTATATKVTFTAPHQAMYTAGDAEVALYTETIAPVPSANASSSGNGSAANDGVSGDVADSTTTPSPTQSTPASAPVATSSVAYAALTAVDRQLEYAMRYWSDYNLAEYGNMNSIGGDCANFVNQTLVARGLSQRDDWHNHGGTDYTSTWTYCPAMDPWLDTNASSLGLTRRSLDERDEVKVGDIVMWDWNDNDSPDHTTIVSEVFPQDDGTVLIKTASHNEDGPYRDLDEMITVQHPGGTAWFHTFA